MNYYGHSLPNQMTFGSPNKTYCLNPMRYHGVSIENTCYY